MYKIRSVPLATYYYQLPTWQYALATWALSIRHPRVPVGLLPQPVAYSMLQQCSEVVNANFRKSSNSKGYLNLTFITVIHPMLPGTPDAATTGEYIYNIYISETVTGD